MTFCHCDWRRRCVAVAVGGVLLLTVGVVMIPLVRWVIHSQIQKKVVLTEGSEFYKLWTDIPYPIYMQYYVFDLINPEEVSQGGRPCVEERGPYTYREYRIKENLTHNANGTLTFRQRKYWKFEHRLSVGVENDTVTTPNLVLLSLVESLRWEEPFIQDAISLVLSLSNEDLFLKKTVAELLWGYKDPLLTIGQKYDKSWFYTNIAGYFSEKNNSYDGTYTVFTGENDLKKVGVIDKYNGTSFLKYWSTPWANMINGTDGTIAPPFLEKGDTLHMFSTDICRSVYGEYSGRVSTPQGIELYRYSSTKDELGNVTANPDNLGFCTPQTNCLPSGLLNLTQCQLLDGFHAPVIVSFPHFYMADPRVVAAIDGVHPDPDQHRTDIDVEPNTGAVLQVFKRLQINLKIIPMENINQLKNVRDLVLPVFWLNESAVVDDKTASMLTDQLFIPKLAAQIIQYMLIAIGGFICFVVLLFILSKSQDAKHQQVRNLTRSSKTEDTVPIVNESDQNCIINSSN